jgi:hypothetical protein
MHTNVLDSEMQSNTTKVSRCIFISYLYLNLSYTEEHAEVKRQVNAADSHDFNAPDYGDVMAKAVTTFIEHALEEEEQQFSLLKAKLNPEESDVCSYPS